MSNYKDIALYKKNATEARENNELELYRASFQANIVCKEAIEKAIRENFIDSRFDSEAALDEVLNTFGRDRVEYVLAKTVQYKHNDGRFQDCNKKWAESIHVTELPTEWGIDRSCYFVVEAHPVLTDALVTRYCKRFSPGEYAGKEND